MQKLQKRKLRHASQKRSSSHVPQRRALRHALCALVVILALLSEGTAIKTKAAAVPYRVRINRATNVVSVYGRDGEGNYTLPIIGFTCSTGKNNGTPTGTFRMSDHYVMQEMFSDGNVHAQYAVRFFEHCLTHGVPDATDSKSSLITKYYNQLGEQASAGCVRLTVADAKWIHDNCAAGTEVEVYDDPNDYGAFGKPMVPTIPEGHQYARWDPTDPDAHNPWIKERPIVLLRAEHSADKNTLVLPAGTSYETLYDSIAVVTPMRFLYAPGEYGLDIFGYYDLNTPGNYTLYVRGHDLATTLRGDLTVKLIVN